MIINNKLIKVNYSPTRFGDHVRLIVLHTEQGYEGGTAAWFANPAAQASAHYGIDVDGTVDQFVSEGDTAWHAGVWSVNTGSIGIEHSDLDQPNTVVRPDAQYDTSARLVADLCRRFGLDCNRTTVKKHNEVSNSHPDCPGNLDVDRVVELAQALLGAKQEATVVAAASVPNVTPIDETVTVTITTLNVRQGPGTQYAGSAANTKDGMVHDGTAVHIVGYTTGTDVNGNPYWLETLNELGEHHWIWAGGTSFVVPVTPAPPTAPAPTPAPDPVPAPVLPPVVVQPEPTVVPEAVPAPVTTTTTAPVDSITVKPTYTTVTGSATLSSDGLVYNLITGDPVAQVPKGTTITVGASTIVSGTVYLVTENMLDQGLNEGIPSTYFVRRVDSDVTKPGPVTLAQIPKGWHPILRLLALVHKIKL